MFFGWGQGRTCANVIKAAKVHHLFQCKLAESYQLEPYITSLSVRHVPSLPMCSMSSHHELTLLFFVFWPCLPMFKTAVTIACCDHQRWGGLITPSVVCLGGHGPGLLITGIREARNGKCPWNERVVRYSMILQKNTLMSEIVSQCVRVDIWLPCFRGFHVCIIYL